jgi:acetylornithine deacetylase
VTLGRALDEGRAWAEELLARLVACPSITGEPSGIAEILRTVMQDLGFHVDLLPVDLKTLESHPEYSPPSTVHGGPAPIVRGYVSDVRAAASDGQMLLFAHTDTEPVCAGWSSDPFTLTVTGGRATGLGVADDKGGIVAILAAARAVRAANLELRRVPQVMLASGKQGGALGTLPGTLAARGVADAVYSHPAESGRGLEHLKVASRGVVQFGLTIEGVTPRPGEERTPVSADPRLGRNAAERAAHLAHGLAAERNGIVRTVTGLTSTARPFEVPARSTITLACWFVDGTVTDLAAGLQGELAELARDDWERAHPPSVRVVGVRANPATCEGTAFAAAVGERVTATTGVAVQPYDWHSASDIRFPLRCLGVPAVGFGATAGNFYGPDEWLDLDSLHTSTAVIAGLLSR